MALFLSALKFEVYLYLCAIEYQQPHSCLLLVLVFSSMFLTLSWEKNKIFFDHQITCILRFTSEKYITDAGEIHSLAWSPGYQHSLVLTDSRNSVPASMITAGRSLLFPLIFKTFISRPSKLSPIFSASLSKDANFICHCFTYFGKRMFLDQLLVELVYLIIC